MKDPDNFLSRWSRRKHEADTRGEQDVAADPAPKSTESPRPQASEGDSTSDAPAFDVDRLPPIESIDAGTDISDFLRPGVPKALRYAALRRAWSADPAIRDYVGINENYWDAAGPNGVPGFGALDPTFDVERLVSELFGERPREPAAQVHEHEAVPPATSGISDAGAVIGEPATNSGTSTLPQRNENVAMQTKSDDARPTRTANRVRRHGGAMPQ